ncbi:glycosyltransferase family 8 protein [Sulfuricurvum sp.]|uniref:glycosyltransferase family 8 protein n=1 Tax=Sulfuricurvum sp. TaxID=2025608 RepID=UPI00199BAAC8|nr:glycosyltransferase family 8 protein [Sulfuricurvum sp.]MBD3805965.1 glycosyltransferase family 8 protein [Sulfuricurvum sp.]
MNNINIAYASDNNFVQHLAVSIASLIKNHHDITNKLCIYILDGGISLENRKKIQQLEPSNKTTQIRFILIQSANFFNEFNVFNERYPISIYYRLSLPNLLSEVDKIIYLDCDTVVISSIKELWEIETNNAPLLAVEEPFPLNAKRLILLGLDVDAPYFNSGVLVLNLAWMRTHRCYDDFRKIANTFQHRLLYPDQDILNIYFQKLWKPINPKFNAFFFVLQKKYINAYRSYSPILIKEAIKTPVIIHFNQTPKPWEYGCLDYRKKLYYRYLKCTDFWKDKIGTRSDMKFLVYLKNKIFFYLENNFPFVVNIYKKLI